MLKDWILRSSSQRYICKVVSAAGGIAILALSVIEKLPMVSTIFWVASPLLLLWLMDTGLATERRRCAELLKKNPAKDDPSAVLWEGGDAGLFRFFRELISLSIWPFYLILFLLVGFGGEEITKANKVAAEAVQKIATVAPVPPYYQQSNVPTFPNRPPTFNQMNPAMQRFTPSPFPTPPRFPTSVRPFATPPKVSMTPPSSPASSPAPAVKGL